MPRELAGLRWRFVGPYRGGRTMAVAGHPTDRPVFYAGTSSGGVWKTADGGVTWANISDGFFRRASVGALAIAETDPHIIYVGMGECGLRANVTHGDGVYKSSDGGATWQHLELAETQNIARIRVHPRDPDLVYVAAFGHRFGPNEERGVYRSRDGGRTWQRILFHDRQTGAIDLWLDAQNPRVLYAVLWEAHLAPWRRTNAGPGSGLYRSADGGDTWTNLTDNPGLPAGPKGRIGVTASPVRPGRVWAIIDAAEGGIYRSDDAGATWTWLNGDRNFLVRPWYFGHVLADPRDPHAVWVVNRKLWKSADGGRTYRQVNVPYVDEMDLWIDPRDPNRLILGNDGGVAVSFDGGETWSTIANQPTAELYRLAADSRFPYRVYSAQQDNSTFSLPSRSDKGPISLLDAYDVGGGEGGFVAVRPDNPNIVYASDLPGLGVTRYDHGTGQIQEIGPWSLPGCDDGDGPRPRFNWSVPVVLSPHDPTTLYVAGNHVYRTTNEGRSWEIFSPDLTRHDEEKIAPPVGCSQAGEGTGSDYCTIASLAPSPRVPGMLWAGSDDGLVHRTDADNPVWVNVTPPELPAWATVQVEASPHDPARAYVAASAHALDDFHPYLFKTTNWGQTWTAIAEGLPADQFVRVVREDPVRPGLLYVGTEAGLFVSLDDGATWRSLRLNLPVVAVHDLLVKDGDLIAATHGRGLWILDDITPLREIAGGWPAGRAHLFAPRPVHRVTRHVYGLDSLMALYAPYAAANPPSGVIVHFLLNEPAERVTLSLLDGQGRVVNSFDSRREPRPPAPIGPMIYHLRGGSAVLTGTVAGEPEPGVRWGALTLDRRGDPRHLPTEPGLHRAALDVTYPGARPLPGVPNWGITAPIVPPGTYTLRLTVDGETWTQPVTILPDPRVATPAEAYREQLALMFQIRDKVDAVHAAVRRIRALVEQLEARSRAMATDPRFRDLVGTTANIVERLRAIEAALIQPGLHERSGELDSIHFPIRLNHQLAALGYQVARSDDAPTAQSHAIFDHLARQVDAHLAELDELIARDIAAFSAAAAERAVPAVVVPAAE